MAAGKLFFACTTAALPAPPRSPIRSGMTKRETPFAGGRGVRVLLQRHPADKVVDEVRCHSEFDESEEEVMVCCRFVVLCRGKDTVAICQVLTKKKDSPVGAGE